MQTTSIAMGQYSGWGIALEQLKGLYSRQRRERGMVEGCRRPGERIVYLALDLLPMAERDAVRANELVDAMRANGYSGWGVDHVRDTLLHCGHSSIKSRVKAGRGRVFWVVA